MRDIKEVLATAIEFERFGQEYYLRFHDLIRDEKAKLLMKSLANDEKEHETILRTELANLGGAAILPSKELLDKGISEIFPKRTAIDSLESEGAISAIKAGIATEQRSIEFYAEHASSTEPRLRDLLKALEKMERGHLELLEENLRFLRDDGVWYGYLPILD